MDEYINIFNDILKTIIIAGTTLRVIQNLMKCQTEGVSLKEGIHKSKKVLTAGIIAIVLPSLMSLIRTNYMKDVDVTQPQKNIIYLIKAITNILLTIEPVLVAFKIMIELVAYKTAEEGMKAEHKSNAVKIAITGVLIICSTSVINIILNYYK